MYEKLGVALAAAVVLFAGACKKPETPAPAAPAAKPKAVAMNEGDGAPSSQPSAAKAAAPAAAKAAAPAAAAAPALKPQTQTSAEVKLGETTKCPIMNEEFVVEADSDFVTWKGKKIYFCCPGKCKKKFEKDPLKYLPAT